MVKVTYNVSTHFFPNKMLIQKEIHKKKTEKQLF